MLQLENLSAGYHNRPALHSLSLSVPSGQTLALIGPNGAGKTTLIRAVSGLLRLLSGRVLVNGEPIDALSPQARARLIAVAPQARHLPGEFTVEQTVLLGRTPYLGWLGRPGRADYEHAWRAMSQTQVEHLAARRVGELSGGEQQRVLLARALAQQTPVLLLDEPTTHLDLQHQTAFLSLTSRLAHEHGLTILAALHDLNLAARYAEQIALLDGGRLRACGAPAEVLTPEILSAAYRLPLQVFAQPDAGGVWVVPA